MVECTTPILRRVISECDDNNNMNNNNDDDVRMDHHYDNDDDDVGTGVCNGANGQQGIIIGYGTLNNINNNNHNHHFTSNSGQQHSTDTHIYDDRIGNNNNGGEGGVTSSITMSDITLSTQMDPSDIAPLTLIEGFTTTTTTSQGEHGGGDDDNKYEENSSLSCDDSDESHVDINNMVLLHDFHNTTGHTNNNNNYNNNNNMITVDPRILPIPPIVLQQQQQQLLQQQQQQQFQRRQDNNNNNSMMRIDESLTSNESYESGSQTSSSQRAPSSQTSDWGYFEDVHQSNDGRRGTIPNNNNTMTTTTNTSTNNNNYNNNNKKSRKNNNYTTMNVRGTANQPTSSRAIMNRTIGLSSSVANGTVLVPQDNDGNNVSAMAVTAPTYVLEESISSQILWKHSAGQRPIQPYEERAFFEKMWAQNFVRSQVNYKMPVEVLTRPSPISLNPFADSNFDTTPDDDHHHVYSDAVITPESVNNGTGNTTNNIAEAALENRMNNTTYPSNALTIVNRTVKDSAGEGDLTVLVRGDNVFGTTVSKSFARSGSEYGPPISTVDTVNISIASYRVVENKKHVKYAQFLVIYREGSIRDTVGVWKRYRDFEELANKVTQAHEGCSLAKFANNISPLAITIDDDNNNNNDEAEAEHLPNAVTSWRLLKKRQRWYRCLDAGYLSLKVFLLERFLHDILFESSSPLLLREFVGVDSTVL